MPHDHAIGLLQDGGPGDSERLQLLHRLALNEQPTEPALEALVRAAARVTGCAVALVNLIDAEDAHHVARVGLAARCTPREQTFCHTALADAGDYFEVEDLASDPRFADLALVQGTTGLRHYASVPLRVGGQVLGTLCVIDPQPGRLAEADRATLQDLGHAAEAWLTLLHQRRLAEAQEQRLMDLVRAGSDWVWELDEQGRVVWLDGDFEACTGRSAADQLGRPFDTEALLAVGGLPPEGCHTLQDVLQRQEAFTRLVSRLVTPSGARILSRSAHPVHDLHGRFRGFRGASRDITLAVQHENAQREIAVDEGTRRHRSNFLSRVSHELRTPLNAILGFTQLMAQDRSAPLPPVQAERLASVQHAGRSLVEMVDDMLEIVLLQQGDRTLTPQAVTLWPLAQQALAEQRGDCEARQLAVTLTVPDGLQAMADPEALQQVLRQLVSNAVKYNRPGGRLALRAWSVGARVWLAVEDSGEGLGADKLRQLFEPFERAGAQRVPGSGLGLTLVRALMLAMHGQVQAHSQPGQGSTFEIELPGVVPATPASAAPEPARRVLYVEDEPLNILLLQEVFKARPAWELRVARDGEEGLATAREWVPDLALIDMNLPDCTGLEVLAHLRAEAPMRRLRCIALSADAMSEQVAAARAAGFDDYWTKPVDLNRLLEAVGEALQLGPRDDAPPGSERP